jgi:lauroyl/myristoyl acyltransferase
MTFFGAMPAAWIDPLADALGLLVYAVDRRGRRVGRQNLDVVFGDRRGPSEKRAILRRSTRESVRTMIVLLHAAPLTPPRFRRWVDIEPEVEETLLDWARRVTGAVVVSAHVGNWEMLLGLANVFRHILPVMFLVEASFSPGLNRFLADVRGTGGGESESREGGAGALGKHVRTGGRGGARPGPERPAGQGRALGAVLRPPGADDTAPGHARPGQRRAHRADLLPADGGRALPHPPRRRVLPRRPERETTRPTCWRSPRG